MNFLLNSQLLAHLSYLKCSEVQNFHVVTLKITFEILEKKNEQTVFK